MYANFSPEFWFKIENRLAWLSRRKRKAASKARRQADLIAHRDAAEYQSRTAISPLVVGQFVQAGQRLKLAMRQAANQAIKSRQYRPRPIGRIFA